MRILNLGSLNIDKVYDVAHFARAAETIPALGYSEFAGGKGLNQSVAAARAGAEVYHLGAVGADGEGLKALLDAAGAHTDCLRVLPEPSGHAIIQVNAKGENSIIVFGGANRRLTEGYIDEAFSRFSPGDLLMLQNETNGVPYAMRTAKRMGFKIAFNPSPVTEALFAYPLELVDYFILNEVEGNAIAGIQTGGFTELLKALAAKFPAAAVVLTVGKAGAYYHSAGKALHHGIYDVPVADTTAAGDTFCGYILAGLAKGLDAQEALHTASIASSLAVSQKGAAPSIPSWQQVRQAGRRFGETGRLV
jgi:ribokinase